MDLETELLREHSKRQATKIARWVGNDRRRFRQLMECYLGGEFRVTQRSAWVVGLCAESNPALIQPWLKSILTKMEEPGVHGAVRRNGMRILANVDIPRRLQGTVVTRCFDAMASDEEEIAVKVHAMMTILRVARTEPGLRNELRGAVGQLLPVSGPAIQARARMVLAALERMEREGRTSESPAARRR